MARVNSPLPSPSTSSRSVSLALAIVLEIAGFRYLMPIMRSRGERALVSATLGIVGAHFLVMLPAFGPLIGGLGLGCMLNAAGLWRISRCVPDERRTGMFGVSPEALEAAVAKVGVSADAVARALGRQN